MTSATPASMKGFRPTASVQGPISGWQMMPTAL